MTLYCYSSGFNYSSCIKIMICMYIFIASVVKLSEFYCSSDKYNYAVIFELGCCSS